MHSASRGKKQYVKEQQQGPRGDSTGATCRYYSYYGVCSKQLRMSNGPPVALDLQTTEVSSFVIQLDLGES